MGTSGSSSGSPPSGPLVPTWLEPDISPPPDNNGTSKPEDGQANDGGDDGQQPPPPPIEPAGNSDRFRRARRDFTSFVRSGGRDERALGRAISSCVSSGTGGSGNAVRRMGSSRQAAANVLHMLGGAQRDGAAETLQQFNLQHLVGRPVEDVFHGLTEIICDDGGSIDEGIARDAWLETVSEIDVLGITDFDSLTNEQIQEIFITLIVHTIEGRLFQDIGANGIRFAQDNNAVRAVQDGLRSYIEGGVRDAFSLDLSSLKAMSHDQIKSAVDTTYRETWELLENWEEF